MKMDSEEELDTTTIMSLPREARELIYNQVESQKELVQLRLVCQEWREEIDDLCEFHVTLDDRSAHWPRVLELRIKSCEVLSFLHAPPQGPGTTCLKYPNLIRSLHIQTTQITPNNFFYLLSDCSASLRQLSLWLNFPLLAENTFPTSLSTFNFERLEELEVSVSTVTHELVQVQRFHVPPEENQEVLFTQLMLNPMRALKHAKVEIRALGAMQVSKFTAVVLRFLSTHWTGLKTLDFELIQGHHGIPSSLVRPLNDSDLESHDFASLDKVKGLSALRLVSSSPIGVDLWIRVMENQTRLQFLEVDILPAAITVFRTVIFRNFETLTSLEITDLSVWSPDGESEPFDLSILGPCSGLKKLFLDRNVASSRRGWDTAELLNLSDLPKSLNDLALNYFNIISDELMLLAATEAGHNIRSITLTQCGKTGPFGITGTVLSSLIALQSIIFIEISVLNFSDPEERIKLNQILETYGYGEDHSYFQLSKLTSLIQGLLTFGQGQEDEVEDPHPEHD